MILPKIDLGEPSEALVYAENLMNDLEQVSYLGPGSSESANLPCGC
jgi:hypothetical protein